MWFRSCRQAFEQSGAAALRTEGIWNPAAGPPAIHIGELGGFLPFLTWNSKNSPIFKGIFGSISLLNQPLDGWHQGFWGKAKNMCSISKLWFRGFWCSLALRFVRNHIMPGIYIRQSWFNWDHLFSKKMSSVRIVIVSCLLFLFVPKWQFFEWLTPASNFMPKACLSVRVTYLSIPWPNLAMRKIPKWYLGPFRSISHDQKGTGCAGWASSPAKIERIIFSSHV